MIIVGASFLVGGIVQAIMAVQVRSAAKGWVWSFILGLLSVIAGLIVLYGTPAYFLSSCWSLLLAGYVIRTGVTLIMLSLAERKAATALAQTMTE